MKSFKLFLFISFPITLSIISLCFPQRNLMHGFEMQMAEIKVDPINKVENTYQCISSVDHQLILMIQYMSKFNEGTYTPNLMNNAQAFPLHTDQKYENPLIETSFKLYFQEAFLYKDEMIPAKTDLFIHQHIKKELSKSGSLPFNHCLPRTKHSIRFSDLFFREANFKHKTYHLTLEANNTEKRIYTCTIEVPMN